MSSVAREFFSVDLRGLRAALAARATRDGVTESDVLRGVLSAALGLAAPLLAPSISSHGAARSVRHTVKLSVRLSQSAAHGLDRNARAAGLSRGAYLMGLIDGAPAVMASADCAAGFAALSASADELALLSRDINQLTRLLRQGDVKAAREYADRHERLDADVRVHLDLAAAALAKLKPASARKGLPASKQAPTRSDP